MSECLLNVFNEDKKRPLEQQVGLSGGGVRNTGWEIELREWKRGTLADRTEDHGAGLVPSRARTCEHEVDTPHQPPSPPLHLPSRLSFSTWLACHLSSGWPLASGPPASRHHLALARFSLRHASSLWTWWKEGLKKVFHRFMFCFVNRLSDVESYVVYQIIDQFSSHVLFIHIIISRKNTMLESWFYSFIDSQLKKQSFSRNKPAQK